MLQDVLARIEKAIEAGDDYAVSRVSQHDNLAILAIVDANEEHALSLTLNVTE